MGDKYADSDSARERDLDRVVAERLEAEEFDFDAAYRHVENAGIAWRPIRYYTEREYDEFDDFEEHIHLDQIVCHMVGDDREFIHDIDDLVKLDESEYCSGCGQIGCGWC